MNTVAKETCRAGHLPAPARANPASSSRPALVLADPPEAGWRTRSNERATADAELLAAPEVAAKYPKAARTTQQPTESEQK